MSNSSKLLLENVYHLHAAFLWHYYQRESEMSGTWLESVHVDAGHHVCSCQQTGSCFCMRLAIQLQWTRGNVVRSSRSVSSKTQRINYKVVFSIATQITTYEIQNNSSSQVLDH